MDPTSSGDVIARHPGNPLLRLSDLPFRSNDIWNAAVVRFEDEILLLVTVETLDGRYGIFRAHSPDGERFAVEAAPFMAPAEDGPARPYESLGVRNPRITPMDGEYIVAYDACGDHGMRLGLARTRDFRSAERIAYVSQVDVTNGALFPTKLNGRYVLLKRPRAGASIWLSTSDDLMFWGESTVVMAPRGGHWDADRIGPSAPPMEIDAGWLLIYYGEKRTSAGPLVRLGAAILDRDNPARVLARSNIPILSPREKYERIGDVPNVVFSCGALREDRQVNLYYGASDSCICRGTASVDEIVEVCTHGEGES